MPIIAISRGSYSRGSEVANRIAELLGYKCISREILIQASNTFNIPEIKLVHEYPRLDVRAKRGEVFIRVDTGLTGMALKTREEEIIRRIEEIALTLGGAHKVKVSLGHSIPIG
jgi:hypothetical protein